MLAFVNNEAVVLLGYLLTLLAPVIVGIGFTHYFLVRKKLKRLNQNQAQPQTQSQTQGQPHSQAQSDPQEQ